jgi:hypothetical protein
MSTEKGYNALSFNGVSSSVMFFSGRYVKKGGQQQAVPFLKTQLAFQSVVSFYLNLTYTNKSLIVVCARSNGLPLMLFAYCRLIGLVLFGLAVCVCAPNVTGMTQDLACFAHRTSLRSTVEDSHIVSCV